MPGLMLFGLADRVGRGSSIDVPAASGSGFERSPAADTDWGFAEVRLA